MNHRPEILDLIEKGALLPEVLAFFKTTYGYERGGVNAILEQNGICWPKLPHERIREERIIDLQEMSCSDLDSLGVDSGNVVGWEV